MKKIIFSILVIILSFFFIGLFWHQKNYFQQKSSKNLSQTQSFSPKPFFATTSFENLNPFLKNELELQQKINKDILKLTENIIPDENKNFSDYKNDINKIQEKFKIEKNQDLQPAFFINLAKELSKIRPPTLFYQFHLELIKIYYSIGLALEEFKTTNDPFKKLMLYNFIKVNLEKLNIK